MDMYPEEELNGDYEDDGTMPDNVDQLRQAVVGRRIVSADVGTLTKDQYSYGYRGEGLIITLDDGTQVELADTSDCCAYTELESFFLDPNSVDHVIMGVGTTDGYDTWHIYADYGDILKLQVGWSAGNPFYYGYGFNIRVREVEK